MNYDVSSTKMLFEKLHWSISCLMPKGSSFSMMTLTVSY